MKKKIGIIVSCVMILIGMIYGVMAVTTYPLVMYLYHDNAWWMIGYIGYLGILYVVVKAFIDR